MNVTVADLRHQVAYLREHGQISVIDAAIGAAHAHPSIDLPLFIALASRETNCRNEVGDGGHGRGLIQIDDRSWGSWLAEHVGCKSGSFTPTHGGATAATPGYCPTVSSAVTLACRMLTENISASKRIGVPVGKRLKFALSAYNAGLGGATTGYRQHGDSDHNTAGGDYAEDVMARAHCVKGLLK